MKKIYILFLFSVCSFFVKAQYTLTSSSLPSPGDLEIRHYTTNTIVPLGSSGTGQTWNYTTLDISWNSYANNYISMASVANGSLYPSGTLGSFVSPGYCRVFENNSVSSKVIGETAPTASSCAFYSNTKTIMVFPFSFGSVINDTYAYSDPGSSNVGTITISGDGTGTLLTPGKTFTNVLKVRYSYTEISTIASVTYTTVAIEESFYNSTDKFPILTIGNSTNTASSNTVVSITNWAQVSEYGYLDINEFSLQNNFKSFPNPNNGDHLNLAFRLFESENFIVMIYNSIGQQVKVIDLGQLPSGLISKNIDITELENGTYYLKINSKNNEISKQLVIIR